MAKGYPGTRKWMSILVNDAVDPSLRLWRLSAEAHGVYVRSIGYTITQEWDYVPEGAIRLLLGRKSKKIIAELVDGGFWRETEPLVGDGRAWEVLHEGTYWRRGKVIQRPPIPTATRAYVMERDGFACVECGATEWLGLDHIHPYSLGGNDDPENLRVLCRSCNSRKGARTDAP